MELLAPSANWRITALVALTTLLVPSFARGQDRPVLPPPSPGALASAAISDTSGTSWNDPSIATLMLVDDLGADARAVVVRRPGAMPNNVILVTRSTTPRDLADAVSALIKSRANRGEVVDREMRALIGAKPQSAPPSKARGAPSGATAPAGAVSGRTAEARRVDSGSPSVRLAAADLQRLRAAPSFTIPGVGTGPALVIRMKAKAGPPKR